MCVASEECRGQCGSGVYGARHPAKGVAIDCLFPRRLFLVGGATQHAHVHPVMRLLTCSHIYVCTHLLAIVSILIFSSASFATHQENRLLHWTVEHPDDIARSNFLRGDHAHFFTNLDRVSSQQELYAALKNRLIFAPALLGKKLLGINVGDVLQFFLGANPYYTILLTKSVPQ